MQPVEKLIYDENSSVRFNTIKRLETELKWRKLLQSASPLGFNDTIYQVGNISKMSDFDVLPISVLRILDIDSNKFYDRNHQMYEAALLTRCFTQHALRPFIDDEINHQRRFIIIPFINKRMDFIELPSIFHDKSVTLSIPDYLKNSEPPIICYKYNKPIKNMIFNFNKLVSDLDIHANTPSEIVKILNLYTCQPVMLALGFIRCIITDFRIRNIVSKGPKYRFPSQIDFNRCREEIASALNDFGNRWCKRERVECNALKEWKLNIFNIVDKRIKFYSQNKNL